MPWDPMPGCAVAVLGFWELLLLSLALHRKQETACEWRLAVGGGWRRWWFSQAYVSVSGDVESSGMHDRS